LSAVAVRSVESGPSANSWTFQFDLGGILEVWPSAAYEASDDLSSLQTWIGDIAAMRSDSVIVFGRNKLCTCCTDHIP
jgi:hypothetical protein